METQFNKTISFDTFVKCINNLKEIYPDIVFELYDDINILTHDFPEFELTPMDEFLEDCTRDDLIDILKNLEDYSFNDSDEWVRKNDCGFYESVSDEKIFEETFNSHNLLRLYDDICIYQDKDFLRNFLVENGFDLG